MTRTFWIEAFELLKAALAGALLIAVCALLAVLSLRWVILASVGLWLAWRHLR